MYYYPNYFIIQEQKEYNKIDMYNINNFIEYLFKKIHSEYYYDFQEYFYKNGAKSHINIINAELDLAYTSIIDILDNNKISKNFDENILNKLSSLKIQDIEETKALLNFFYEVRKASFNIENFKQKEEYQLIKKYIENDKIEKETIIELINISLQTLRFVNNFEELKIKADNLNYKNKELDTINKKLNIIINNTTEIRNINKKYDVILSLGANIKEFQKRIDFTNKYKEAIQIWVAGFRTNPTKNEKKELIELLKFISNLKHEDNYYKIVKNYCFTEKLTNKSFNKIQKNIKKTLQKGGYPTNNIELLLETATAIKKASDEKLNPEDIYFEDFSYNKKPYNNERIIIFIQRQKINKTISNALDNSKRATTEDNAILSFNFIDNNLKEINNIGIASNYMFNLRQVATYNIYLKDIIKELKEQKNELENYNNKLENILKLKLFPVITDIKEEYNKITKSNIPLKDYMKIYTHI